MDEITIRIMPNDSGMPSGKLADAEVCFNTGIMADTRLLGFAVWERGAGPKRHVTFPARTYSVAGERRSFALLRPTTTTGATDRLGDMVLAAYAAYEAKAANLKAVTA